MKQMVPACERMWQRAFERRFLELRRQGIGEDLAIAIAEREANDAQDRYIDDKLAERKEQA
jgi:hypothetical protein